MGFLKARRRVEDEVESVEARIAGFIETGGRPRDMVEKAASLSRELEGLRKQAVELEEEEVKINGHTSGSLVALVSEYY